MKPQFTINNKTYFFQDITLRKYNALQNYIGEETTENKFNIVSCVTECPPEDLRKLPYKDWSILWEECLFHISFTTSTDAIQPTITFNGIEYGLPDVDTLTIGEFIDLDLLLQGEIPKWNQVAGILYRPVLKKTKTRIELEPYDPKTSADRAEAFLDLPIRAIKSANAFFLHSVKLLQKNILASLEEMKNLKTLDPEDLEQLQNLLQQDPGGWSLTDLQEKAHYILDLLPNSPSEQFSTGWLGKRLKSKSNKIK